MSLIPSVDLQDFLSDDASRKQKFVDNLGAAFENIGYVALRGHFLDANLVDRLYTQVKAFFALPEETKKKYEIPNIGGQRGYVGFGKETAKGFKKADLKEFWHFGQYLPEGSPLHAVYPPNVWVEELPDFNTVGKEAFQMLEKTGQYVLRAIALHLQLDEFYFDKHITEGNSILRALHYPPITTEPEEAVRAAAHGDINLITLLMGAHGKGLQVQNHQGEWIDAIAQPEELMINVGDMLSRHTNNQLKSTIHRVVNPEREFWGESRYSIPFFLHPVATMPLNVLPETLQEGQQKLFADITAGEFLNERLIELELVKKQ